MLTKFPLVSVIIPLYNHQTYVETALKSVFNQTYPRLEIIVVDDGSEDKSVEVVRDQITCSPHPLHIHQQRNQGAHAAINNGIAQSTGKYIAILNSDDCFDEDRVMRMVQLLDEDKAAFAFSGVRHIDQEGELLSDQNPFRHYYQKSLRHAKRFPTPAFELIRHNFATSTGNFIFTRGLFDEVGPFQDYETCHDWDFLLRVILVEEPLFVKRELYQYRIHGKNTLRKREEVRDREILQVINNYLQQMDGARNPCAPSPSNWGDYWSYFVRRYMKHFLVHEELRDLLMPDVQVYIPSFQGRRGRMVEISYRILFGGLRLWNQFPIPAPGVGVREKAVWAKTWTRYLSSMFPAGEDELTGLKH